VTAPLVPPAYLCGCIVSFHDGWDALDRDDDSWLRLPFGVVALSCGTVPCHFTKSTSHQRRRSTLRNVKRVFRTLVTAAALALVSIAAHAATIRLTGDLKASAEVPPKDSAGTGTVTATLDTETNEFKYHVEFSGLTGPVVAAHFHGPAAAGANAKPQLPIKTSPITSPIDGTATLTPEQAKELVNGRWYFNLHTSANPGGEIRGQILKSE
jgi:hypothetical protein